MPPPVRPGRQRAVRRAAVAHLPVDHLDGHADAGSGRGVPLVSRDQPNRVEAEPGRYTTTRVAQAVGDLRRVRAEVVAAGVAARAPLSRVPENSLKHAVGVMLTAFGMFWGGEGAGAEWPGGDAAILALIAFTFLVSVAFVAALRRRHAELSGPASAPPFRP